MKLSKLHRRPLRAPFLKRFDKPQSSKIFLAGLLLSMIILIVAGLLAQNPFLRQAFHFLEKYFLFSIQKIQTMTPAQKFWLVAPALLFDTTRYYITNILVFFLQMFGFGNFPKKILDPSPFVSVLVPVYNEEKTLSYTLDSLLENNYPHFEVIVVDDCSQDRTESICRQYQQKGKIVYLRKQIREGKPHSLNYARQFAKGEIVVHVDGDCMFYRDALSEAVKYFADPKVGAVAGNLKVMNDRMSFVAALQAIEYAICIGVQRQWLAMTDTLQIASGAFSCFRKKILQDLKGVDAETGEDLDITLKVRKMGYKIAFAPRAICFTEVPESARALARQRILWDRCYIRINLRKHFNIVSLKNFRIGDFLAVVTDLIFNLLILLLFPVYVAYVILYYPFLLPFLFLITFVFYTAINFIQILIAIYFSSNPKRDLIFVLYTPFFFLYSLYLRFFRAFAYVLEIFRVDYNKRGYFPEKVWKSMPEHW